MTLVSVLISTYHRPNLLRGAIESVLDQTYDNVEIVIVNDDNKDTKTKEVINEFEDESVIAIHNDEHIGVSASRNKAASVANGEFICILDDDDRWKPEKIEHQLSKFNQLKDSYAVVYTGGKILGGEDQNRIIGKNSPPASRQGNVWPEILANWGMGPHSSHMIRKSAFDSVDGFDENIIHGEDWDLSIRLAMKYEFAAINAPLTIRYDHEENISQGTHHTDIQRKRVLTKYTQTILSNEEIYHEFFSRWHRHRGMAMLRTGKWTSSIREQWLSIGHNQNMRSFRCFVASLLGPHVFDILRDMYNYEKIRS